MKNKKSFLGTAALFFVLAAVFSIVFWQDGSLAAKIGLFTLGFGSGITAEQWFIFKKG